MKKGDYYKQLTSEVLSGDICLENPEIFKIFIQLKALCFQCEIKETPYTYKQAVKRFEEDNISYLIDEGYVYRINNNECDFLCIPEITENVFEVVDYKKLNSIRGKLGVQKVRLKKLEVLVINQQMVFFILLTRKKKKVCLELIRLKPLLIL
jgi:hypothetical protein